MALVGRALGAGRPGGRGRLPCSAERGCATRQAAHGGRDEGAAPGVVPLACDEVVEADGAALPQVEAGGAEHGALDRFGLAGEPLLACFELYGWGVAEYGDGGAAAVDVFVEGLVEGVLAAIGHEAAEAGAGVFGGEATVAGDDVGVAVAFEGGVAVDAQGFGAGDGGHAGEGLRQPLAESAACGFERVAAEGDAVDEGLAEGVGADAAGVGEDVADGGAGAGKADHVFDGGDGQAVELEEEFGVGADGIDGGLAVGDGGSEQVALAGGDALAGEAGVARQFVVYLAHELLVAAAALELAEGGAAAALQFEGEGVYLRLKRLFDGQPALRHCLLHGVVAAQEVGAPGLHEVDYLWWHGGVIRHSSSVRRQAWLV